MSDCSHANPVALPKLNIKQTVVVGLSFMSITGLWFFFNSVVPPILEGHFGLSGVMTGFIVALNAIFGLMLSPLVGWLSDRTKSRFGRRLPYILGGAVVGGVALALMPLGFETFWLFVLILVITVFAVMAFRTPAVALMPDVTLKPHRTVGNGIINVMGVLGGLVGMVIFMVFINTESHPDRPYRNLIVLDSGATTAFVLVGVLIIVANVILFLVIKENRLVKKREQLQKELGLIEEEAGGAGEKLSKEQMTGIRLLLASVFLWFMAYNAVETWYTTYAFNVLGFSPEAAGMGMIFSLAFGFIAFIPASILAVKIGRKRAVMTGVLIKLAGLAAIYFITPDTSFLVYAPMALVGIGWATINASSFVMVVELSKNTNLGRFVGIYYVASMSAQAVTPILSGLLRDVVYARTGDFGLGLRSIFVYAAVFMGLAFFTMMFAKHGNTYRLEEKVAGIAAQTAEPPKTASRPCCNRPL